MKIYLSIPITGQEETFFQRNKDCLEYLKNKYPNDTIINPLDLNGLAEGKIKPDEIDHDYAWYMGRDVEELLRCDAIYLSDGWGNSKGCTAEYELSKIYNLKRVY